MPKRGFNLIEIAIVLAVIGLVIGGIYIAAAAVMQRMRILHMQEQMVQITQAINTVFHAESNVPAPSVALIKTLQIFPADIVDDGTNFYNEFGGTITFGGINTVTVGAVTNRMYTIAYTQVPTGVCFNVLINLFGQINVLNNFSLRTIQVNHIGFAYDMSSQYSSGFMLDNAAFICGGPLNTMYFTFAIS